MTDHLPECEYEEGPNYTKGVCICPELRACEQRVKNQALAEAAVRINAEHEKGFDAGVQAAREAVRQNMLDMTQLEIAFTAIDALGGSDD